MSNNNPNNTSDDNINVKDLMKNALQPKNLNELKSYSILTNSTSFRKLAKWSFHICDKEKNGTIHIHELYAGTLLVHLELAKYAGIAACYPPSYETIEQLFHAVDDNKSNTIDEEEFIQIVIICCGQILSRIIIYYTFIIVLVPFLADKVIRICMILYSDIGINHPFIKLISFNMIIEKVTSFLMFLLLIPKIFDWIDLYSKQSAHLTKSTTNNNTTTTETEEEIPSSNKKIE